MDRIISYSASEGAAWQSLPPGVSAYIPVVEYLKWVMRGPRRYQNGTKYVCINGMSMHAFSTQRGREWDCVNGWRPQ